VRALLFRRAEEQGMRDELDFHLEQEIQKNLRQGMPPGEARRRALIAFGGMDRFTERVREARGVLWLENLARDVRLAARGLRRNPGFTSVSVLSLAVGIGATTTVFTLANGLLIRPLPGIADPEELFVVWMEEAPGQGTGISPANIDLLRGSAPALEGLVGHAGVGLQALAPDGHAVNLDGAVVEHGYFELLGVEPLMGRFFTEEETTASAAGDVVVVSERFWSQHLGSPAALGQVVRFNAESFTVVGVAPRGFHGIERTRQEDVWLPLAAYNRVRHTPFDLRDARLFFELIGRLRLSATTALAEAQLRDATARLVEADPDANETYATNVPTIYPGIGLDFLSREPTRRTIGMLFGIVSMLLLIACANVANLLLCRSVTRRSEGSVRRALGASGGRLVQQHLAEGLLLSLSGAAAGVGLALLLGAALEGQGQGLLGLPLVEGPSIDWRVLGFATVGALVAGALATALPAALSIRAAGLGSVRTVERSAGGPGAAARSALTVVQIGASLTLLVGALLLVRTTGNLSSVELGFEPEGVSVFLYDPAPQGYGPEEFRSIEQRLLDRLRTTPGVELASVSSASPSFGSASPLRIGLPGDGQEPLRASGFAVSADYFRLLGIPFVAGRPFSEAEEFAAEEEGRGVVLSASTARALFGHTGVIGRVVEVTSLGSRESYPQPVIGVTADIRATSLRGDFTNAVHLPLGAASRSIYQAVRAILVKSALPPDEGTRLVAEAFAEVDPSIPFFRSYTLAEGVLRSAATERLLARLLAAFALLAVGLAAVGLYGVIAYSVQRRRREIGIRMALGSSGRAVVKLVAGRALLWLAAGAVLGVGGGLLMSRVLESRLFGVSRLDPATYVWAVGLFAAVALAASAIPARAATKVDPVGSLKAE
jgi:predicted permease